MALVPANPRDRNLVLVGLLSVGLVAAYQQMYWASENARLNAIEVRLDTLDSLNGIARLEYAKGSVTKMQQEGDRRSRELSALRRLVPTENEVPTLLESISTAARRAGLELVDIQPDGVVKGDAFDTYKYKLGVTGPYHQVAVFLTNIGSLSRIVSPINVSLAPTTRSGELRPRVGEQFLDARFGVQTYVARTAHKPAPAERAVYKNVKHAGGQLAPPIVDTVSRSSIMREVFEYATGRRRDPFVSLLTTAELRPTLSDLRLTSIFIDLSGGNSLATLRDVGANTRYTVRVGSTLGRMRVSSIRGRSVIMTIDEFGTTRQDSLVLRDSTNARKP